MKASLHRLKTFWQLGLRNVAAVALYRAKLRLGYFEKKMPVAAFEFVHNKESWIGEPLDQEASNDRVHLKYFNARSVSVESPPNWFFDPYTATSLDDNNAHWSNLPDFSLNTGDVKVLWELSRFEWLIQASWTLCRSESGTILPIRAWLQSWFESNPANLGVNWKCAQETSIRGMHIVYAALILNKGSLISTAALVEILVEHINRILPTVSFAKAQDNNHGTSEAVALFTLGVALGSLSSSLKNSKTEQLAVQAETAGRKLLENRATHLISADGTFSQYSVVYHRLMLDTICFAECMRRRYQRAPFSKRFYERASAATHWLFSVVDSESGDAPNIGANDGALLFNANSNPFREFRPNCQLATALFGSEPMYQQHTHSMAQVFEIEIKAGSMQSDRFKPEVIGSGFKVARELSTFVVLKTPDDRFRPSQADALHLDVWHNGVNVIRDAGTYSYNANNEVGELGSTQFHSTVQLDDQDQMPKISRFLYSRWLSESTINVKPAAVSERAQNRISSAYVSYMGGAHSRCVSVEAGRVQVSDDVSGAFKLGMLRWRVCPANWTIVANELRSEVATITLKSDQALSLSLTDSLESTHYLEIQPLPVLEVAFTRECRIETTITVF